MATFTRGMVTCRKRVASREDARTGAARLGRRERWFRRFAALLARLGLEERTRGSHHIFKRAGIEEMINLQHDGTSAKSYQVKQVRTVILKHNPAEI
jgi:predicted RNA binding protein YcfA (HicA-like mRNA interferase family)